jgi:hypothetical protein
VPPIVKAPPIPDTPDTEELVSTCVGVPSVGKVAGVKLSVAKSDASTLLGVVTAAVADPLASVGRHLCE